MISLQAVGEPGSSVVAVAPVWLNLCEIPRILGAPARGGMYAFFRIRGLADSLAFCKRLVAKARLGLAPGAAFGDDSPEFVRWCIAADPARLEAGLDPFASYLSAERGAL